jgi:hypothetical protein
MRSCAQLLKPLEALTLSIGSRIRVLHTLKVWLPHSHSGNSATRVHESESESNTRNTKDPSDDKHVARTESDRSGEMHAKTAGFSAHADHSQQHVQDSSTSRLNGTCHSPMPEWRDVWWGCKVVGIHPEAGAEGRSLWKLAYDELPAEWNAFSGPQVRRSSMFFFVMAVRLSDSVCLLYVSGHISAVFLSFICTWRYR